MAGSTSALGVTGCEHEHEQTEVQKHRSKSTKHKTRNEGPIQHRSINEGTVLFCTSINIGSCWLLVLGCHVHVEVRCAACAWPERDAGSRSMLNFRQYTRKFFGSFWLLEASIKFQNAKQTQTNGNTSPPKNATKTIVSHEQQQALSPAAF